jgi:hypothetical protein
MFHFLIFSSKSQGQLPMVARPVVSARMGPSKMLVGAPGNWPGGFDPYHLKNSLFITLSIAL